MVYLKKIGFGAIIWAAIFVAISILIALNVTSAYFTYPLAWIVTIVLAWLFSDMLKVKGLADGFITGILFVATAFVLDWLITTKYTGMSLFSSWDLWVGYGLALLIPVFYGFLKKS